MKHFIANQSTHSSLCQIKSYFISRAKIVQRHMKINDINVFFFLFNSEIFFIFHLHNDLFPDSFMKCFLLGGMINGQTFGLNTE